MIMRSHVWRLGALALFLALVIALCVAVPAGAAPSDIDGHWAEESISILHARGIMNGDGKGSFRPNDPVTRAEFAALVNGAFGFFKDSGMSFQDVKPSDWFAREISVAATQGYLRGVGKGMIAPSDKLTREQAAVIIARIMQLAPGSGETDFTDDSDISPWAGEMVSAIVQKGYMKGSGGRFFPKKNTTRAEVAAIIVNVAGEIFNQAGEYDGAGRVVNSNVTVAVSGVVLKNMTINGNLYITEGVGDGDVTLDGVTVRGETLICGGGINSVIIINTRLGAVTLNVPDGAPVRFAAQGNSSVDSVLVGSNQVILEGGNSIETTIIAIPEGATVELKGSFGRVEVQTPGCAVKAKDGTIAELIISNSAADASVTLENTAAVNSLVCDVNCNIEGGGRIQSATINANKVNIQQRPGSVTVPKGVEATVNGKTVTGGSTGGTSTGGGSGGSGGGGSTSSHRLTLESNPKGAATLQGGGVYRAGTSVTLSVKPVPGWSFDNWTVNGKIVSTKDKFVYVMPKADVTVTANMTKNYKLTVMADPAKGGEVTKSGELAAGAVFTVTATASAGYVFDHWEVDGEIQSVDESFTSVMPYKDTVFTAKFLPENNKDTWNGQTANVIYKLKDGSYLVTSGKQLAWIAEQVNSGKNSFAKEKIVLGTDIDLNNLPWTPIGNDPNRPFKGTFDGKGKTISNLKVNLGTGGANTVLAGLFGAIDKDAKIQKLKLENVNITAEMGIKDKEASYNYAGGLVAKNDGEIKNCSVTGQVTARNGFTNYAGGIAGWNDAGTIKNCFNLARVKVLNTTGAAGGIAGENFGKIETSFNEGVILTQGNEHSFAGGIVGYARNSSTVNCFNTGSVTASGDYVATAGGIVGNCDPASKVETSYNTGPIESSIANTGHPKKINAAGGIIGGLTAASANIKNCYFMSSSANQGVGNPAGTGGVKVLSDTQMRNQSSFMGFDFAKTWYFQPPGEYPYPHLQSFSSTVTLTVKALPAEGGTAKVDKEAGNKFKPGAIVPLLATPKPGYSFVNWTINGMAISEEAAFNYKVPDAKVTITANFVADDPEVYMLSVSASPGNGGTVTGAGSYFAGEKVVLRATPDKDYTFVAWAVMTEEGPEVIGEDPALTYSMPAEDVALTAVFRNANIPEHQLTLLPSPQESGRIIMQNLHIFDRYPAGATLRMIAVPFEGYEFVNWTVDGEIRGTDPELTVTMPDGALTIKANFQPSEGDGEAYKLVVRTNDGSRGTAFMEGGVNQGTYQAGTPVSLTAVPSGDHTFVYWTINGRVVGTEAEFTYYMPKKDTTITANFKPGGLYMVAASSNDEAAGSILIDGENKETEAYGEGDYFELQGVPNEGYVFINWTVDGRPVGWLPRLMYPMPAQDIEVVGNFVPADGEMRALQVEPNVPTGGRIYINDVIGTEGSFPTGTEVYVKAEENSGYAFKNWTIDGEVVWEEFEFIFAMPPGGLNIVANFEAVPITEGEAASVNISGHSISDFAWDGNGVYVGVGENGAVIRSEDNGQTWTQHWSGVSAEAVAYGNGSFVAVGDGIAVSADGKSWSATKDASRRYSDVAYGANGFVALGYQDGEHHIFSSTDGLSWEANGVPAGIQCRAIVSDGSRFVIITNDTTILVSDNDLEWNAYDVAVPGESSASWDYLAYGDGKFVAWFGSLKKGAIAVLKAGAATWQVLVVEGDYYGYRDLYFNEEDFKIRYKGLYSYVAETRTLKLEQNAEGVLEGFSIQGKNQYGDAAAGHLEFSRGNYGSLHISADKDTWTEAIGANPFDFENMAYGNGVYLLAGAKNFDTADHSEFTEGVVLTSGDDGESWEAFTLIPEIWNERGQYFGAVHGIAYGNGRYVAVGEHILGGYGDEDAPASYGYIFTSTDAGEWKVVEQEFASIKLLDVVFSDGTWFVKGHDGKKDIVYTSADGLAWAKAGDGVPYPAGSVEKAELEGCLSDVWRATLDGAVWIFGDKGVVLNSDLSKSHRFYSRAGELTFSFQLGEEVSVEEKGTTSSFEDETGADSEPDLVPDQRDDVLPKDEDSGAEELEPESGTEEGDAWDENDAPAREEPVPDPDAGQREDVLPREEEAGEEDMGFDSGAEDPVGTRTQCGGPLVSYGV